MARSEVTVADLARYNEGFAVVGDAIDLANDHVIDISEVKDDLFMVMIENTSTVAGTATFVAGDGFSELTQGNLEVAIAESAVTAVAVESARFKNLDGTLNIDMASAGALTGNIYATELPK